VLMSNYYSDPNSRLGTSKYLGLERQNFVTSETPPINKAPPRTRSGDTA
jgi:hypothetical protein